MCYLRSELRWWGLYAVALLMVVGIVSDRVVSLPDSWHMILLGLIAILTCVLALRWMGRHYVMLAREDADRLCTSLPGETGASS